MPYTPHERREVLRGFAAGVGVNLVVGAASWQIAVLLHAEFFWPVICLPATQWIFIYPATKILRDREKYGAVRGLLYGAIVSMVATLVFFIWAFSHIDI